MIILAFFTGAILGVFGFNPLRPRDTLDHDDWFRVDNYSPETIHYIGSSRPVELIVKETGVVRLRYRNPVFSNLFAEIMIDVGNMKYSIEGCTGPAALDFIDALPIVAFGQRRIWTILNTNDDTIAIWVIGKKILELKFSEAPDTKLCHDTWFNLKEIQFLEEDSATIWFRPLCDGGSCPISYPFVFQEGKSCCAVNQERISESPGKGCDGGKISWDSTCCESDQNTTCSIPPCIDYTFSPFSDRVVAEPRRPEIPLATATPGPNHRLNNDIQVKLFHPTMTSHYLTGHFGPENAVDSNYDTFMFADGIESPRFFAQLSQSGRGEFVVKNVTVHVHSIIFSMAGSTFDLGSGLSVSLMHDAGLIATQISCGVHIYDFFSTLYVFECEPRTTVTSLEVMSLGFGMPLIIREIQIFGEFKGDFNAKGFDNKMTRPHEFGFINLKFDFDKMQVVSLMFNEDYEEDSFGFKEKEDDEVNTLNFLDHMRDKMAKIWEPRSKEDSFGFKEKEDDEVHTLNFLDHMRDKMTKTWEPRSKEDSFGFKEKEDDEVHTLNFLDHMRDKMAKIWEPRSTTSKRYY